MGYYKFDEIAINSTKKKKPVEEDKYRYIGLEHLDTKSLEVKRFGSEVAPIGDKLIMEKGDVLFGKRRAYQKKVGIAPFDGIFSAHGMVLKPKEDVITKEFFPFFICSDYFLDKAISISVGSLSPTINWTDLKVLEFFIPDKNIQEKYSKILWKFNELKNKYEVLLNKLDEYSKSEFFNKIDGLKEYTTISSYIDDSIDTVKKFFSKDDLIKYLEISSIDGSTNEIVYPEEKKLKDVPSSAKYILKKDDILVSLVRPNLRKNSVVESTDDNIVGTSGFCVLRPLNIKYKSFLKGIINSDIFVNDMVKKSTGSMYPTLKKNDITDYKVKKVPDEILDEIDTFINNVDSTKRELLACIKKLNDSQNKLINDIFIDNN